MKKIKASILMVCGVEAGREPSLWNQCFHLQPGSLQAANDRILLNNAATLINKQQLANNASETRTQFLLREWCISVGLMQKCLVTSIHCERYWYRSAVTNGHFNLVNLVIGNGHCATKDPIVPTPSGPRAPRSSIRAQSY